MQPPALSVIVAFRNMAREAPRTLYTLSPAYQRGVSAADYEVVAVDAGSTIPLDEGMVRAHGPNFRLLRAPDAPSPAGAINAALLAVAILGNSHNPVDIILQNSVHLTIGLSIKRN